MENKQDQVKQQIQEKKARLEQIRDAYHRERELLNQRAEQEKANESPLKKAYQDYIAHQRQYA